MDLFTMLRAGACLLVGGAFVFSGIAKLRRAPGGSFGDATAQSMTALGLNRWAEARWATLAYPWAELALGVAVWALPEPVWRAASLVSIVLLCVLTVLVARAAASDEVRACACFGRPTPLTWRTVTRNALLIAVSLLAAAGPDAPVIALVGDAPQAAAALVVMMLLAVQVTILSALPVDTTPTSSNAQTTTPASELLVIDHGMRRAFATVLDGKPTLLIHVSTSCSSCTEVVSRISNEQILGGRVVVRLIASGPNSGAAVGWLRDPERATTTMLGMSATPSAVLFSADAEPVAAPVIGAPAVLELAEAIVLASASLRPL